MPQFRTTFAPIHMEADNFSVAARRSVNDLLDILGDNCLGVRIELLSDGPDEHVVDERTYTIGADIRGDVDVVIIDEPVAIEYPVLTSIELAWHRAYGGSMGDKTSASDLVRIAEPILGVQLEDDGGTAEALFEDLCNSLTLQQCAARFVARLTERGLLGVPA